MKNSASKPETQFDFFKELNGRELMHWLGTPCFVKEKSKVFNNQVTIITYDGMIFHKISLKDLETMDPSDMPFI
jgi:hypothetical protein